MDVNPTIRGPIRVCSPARACIDTAVALTRESDQAALLIEAVQRRVTTVDALAEWSHRLRTNERVRLGDALRAAASGAWSLPEQELLDLVASSSVLHEPWPNPRLQGPNGQTLISADVWFDDVALAVMVHSFAYHSQGAQWDRTVERDGDLTSLGVIVVGVTPAILRAEPEAFLARLEQTYATAASRPRPRVTALPRLARTSLPR